MSSSAKPYGDDLPPPFMDGWMAHKHNTDRKYNPYSVRLNLISRELWTEGWLAREYAVRTGHATDNLDAYKPRPIL